MVDKEGREAELLELQKAEEAHRELLLKDRDERNKIAKDLHSLRRCGGGACDLEDATPACVPSLNQFIVRERPPVSKYTHAVCSMLKGMEFECASSLCVKQRLNPMTLSYLTPRTPQTL